MTIDSMIPPPSEVRLKLAENIKEGRLLQRLYKLSVLAAQERRELEAQRASLGSRQPEAATC